METLITFWAALVAEPVVLVAFSAAVPLIFLWFVMAPRDK